MSATLYWEPAKRKCKHLPDALKFILRDECGVDSHKSLYTKSNITFLRGLAAAKVEGAQELIDAIEKHEEVEVWLEY